MIFENQKGNVEIAKMSDKLQTPAREQSENDLGVIFCNIITTSINPEQGEILRINLKPCYVGKEDGDLSKVRNPVSFFNVTSLELEDDEKKFVDFDLEEKLGSKIDWQLIKSLFEKADLVVAHNASFVRPWVDKYIGNSEVVWGCTLEHIDWASKGFPSKNLESLSVFSGYYYDFSSSFESLNSVVSCLNKNKALKEFIDRALTPDLQIFAANAPFESKDLLKDRRYRWNPDFSCWWLPLENKEHGESESKWLLKNVSGTDPQIFEIDSKFRFSR